MLPISNYNFTLLFKFFIIICKKKKKIYLTKLFTPDGFSGKL